MKTPQTTKLIPPELARLERQELAISQRRQQLHKEIDRLYLSAPLDDEQTLLLDELEQLEQEVSGERRRLHRRIDDVRKSVGLPTWREQHDEHVAQPLLPDDHRVSAGLYLALTNQRRDRRRLWGAPGWGAPPHLPETARPGLQQQ